MLVSLPCLLPVLKHMSSRDYNIFITYLMKHNSKSKLSSFLAEQTHKNNN